MPKLTNSVPKYRHHKRSGHAVVTLRGRDVYLGPYNSKGSKLEYDRVIAEWLAAGRPTKPVQESCEITVTELVLAYWKFAQSHYVKDGQPTGATAGIKVALRLLRQYYGPTPAVEFGPLALKAMQVKMIELNQSRGYINTNIDRIRRMFKWAASEELIPASIPQALAMVPGLRKGRTTARDLPPVQPVPDSIVDATIQHLPKTVADMVRFQRLTGCRPKEVCILKPIDVDTTGEIWRYQPESHKTEHHGRDRVIFIGPKAQAVLRPYLLRDKRDYCFSPAESERKRSVQRREHRQTPMTPSQRKRELKRQAQRTITPRYNKDSYRRAIQRACELAFGMPKELRVISNPLPNETADPVRYLDECISWVRTAIEWIVQFARLDESCVVSVSAKALLDEQAWRDGIKNGHFRFNVSRACFNNKYFIRLRGISAYVNTGKDVSKRVWQLSVTVP